ncbi:MAG: LPP20 family lipoprotein [Colwellia sp.]|nr:LPP20 family lipoprotein [Colwellia sp.]
MSKITLYPNVFILLMNFVLMPAQAENQQGILTAKGFGTVNMENTSSNFQAKMMARRAAELDAQRQLAETTKGLQISAGTTVEDFEVTSDVIATRVKGLLKGAFVIKEIIKPEDDTFVAEVTLAICLTNESEICRNRDSIKRISESASEKQ